MFEYWVGMYLLMLILQQQGQGQTALHIASADGDEGLVKYFYSARASASITDNQGKL